MGHPQNCDWQCNRRAQLNDKHEAATAKGVVKAGTWCAPSTASFVLNIRHALRFALQDGRSSAEDDVTSLRQQLAALKEAHDSHVREAKAAAMTLQAAAHEERARERAALKEQMERCGLLQRGIRLLYWPPVSMSIFPGLSCGGHAPSACKHSYILPVQPPIIALHLVHFATLWILSTLPQ